SPLVRLVLRSEPRLDSVRGHSLGGGNMTKHLKKWALGIAFGMSALLSLPADAGQKSSYEVYISGGIVTGSLGSARASYDTRQYIGCSNYGTYGYCSATDSNGTNVMCYWSGAAQAQSVLSLGPNSYIYFSRDANSNCSLVVVSNYSSYLPT